jgi:hypothetical protein
MSPENAKVAPVCEPVSSKNIENRRLKHAATSGRTKDFCGTLMGPPSSARKSKTPAASRVVPTPAPKKWRLALISKQTTDKTTKTQRDKLSPFASLATSTETTTWEFRRQNCASRQNALRRQNSHATEISPYLDGKKNGTRMHTDLANLHRLRRDNSRRTRWEVRRLTSIRVHPPNPRKSASYSSSPHHLAFQHPVTDY